MNVGCALGNTPAHDTATLGSSVPDPILNYNEGENNE